MQGIRRETIKELLTERSSIMISELSARLGVSEMTVHRDLDALQEEGFLTKKRGGAVINKDTRSSDTNYRYNYVKNFYVKEKQAIAKTAFSLLNQRETLIFDNSTTVYEVAKLLRQDVTMTVIATNPGVFNELSNSPGITLYSTGGLYSLQTNSLVGSAAEDFIDRVKITTAVLSTACLSVEHGATESYPSEASLKRKIVSAADRTLLLVDHSKFGHTGTEKIAELSDIDVIITDNGADIEYVEQLEKHTKVLISNF